MDTGGRRKKISLTPEIGFAVIVIAVVGLVNSLALDASFRAGSCEEHVQALAKVLWDKPKTAALKSELADAALLCSQGRSEEAKGKFSEIKHGLEELARELSGKAHPG